MKTIRFSILALLLGFFITNDINAQRCDRLDYDLCEEDPGEFEYESQSKVAKLASGDTITIKLAVYSGQLYRFMACYEPEQFGGGEVEFQIFNKQRKYKSVIKDIKVNTFEDVVDKIDNYGNPIMDEYGDIVKENIKVTTRDTIRETIAYHDTKMYYNSNSADKSYLDKEFPKSQSIIIQVIVKGGDPDKVGCVSIMIGRKAKRTKVVTKYSPTREG